MMTEGKQRIMISIDDYNTNENQALQYLSNRAIEAFRPVTFMLTNYPGQVHYEQELIRYIDVMHETKEAKYFSDAYQYSVDEAELISSVCAKVMKLSAESFGRPVRPLMAPLAAITLFRVISEVAEYLGNKSLSVFEIGPGSGYLGALLMNSGHSYASMDITQAFYLWQSRLYNHLAPGEFLDLASYSKLCDAMDIEKRVRHVPWWIYNTFHKECLFDVDIVVCDHALGEVSENALKYIVRVSSQMLSNSRLPLFIFASTGAQAMNKRAKIFSELKEAGLVPIFGRDFFGLVLAGSELGSFALSYDEIFGIELWRRAKRKLQKQKSPNNDFIQRFGEGIPFYNPSKNEKKLAASDFLPVSLGEAPVDYELLSFIGVKTPHDKSS